MTLDLDVTSEPRVWIDNREALVRTTVALHMKGTAVDPRLLGVISAEEGRVTIFDRTFRTDHATVSFVDGRVEEPWIDLAATSRQAGVAIYVTVQGAGETPTIKLTSSPPLPESDIISLLTIGTTREGAQQTDAGTLAASAAGRYAFAQLAEKFRGRNRDIGFLDRITVEADAGRPGTTSSAQSAAEASGPRFTVIYDITDHWATQAERDRWGFYNFDVFYQWRFR
jgi:autotransporter translocation and assembly factor TamB